MIRFIAIAASALAVSGCNFTSHDEQKDPGPTVTRTYQVGAFDKIEVAGPYEVTVTTGGQPGVSATGGDKLIGETKVEVDGTTLKIQPKQHHGLNLFWGHQGKVQFTVTTAMLNAADIAGSGAITVDKVAGDFKGDVAGSGKIKLAAVNGGAMDFSISGSGRIDAAGKATSTKVEIAGSGDFDSSGLAATNADVSIAGSGNIRANASRTAKVEIIGSGNVIITGGAKCEVDKTGSGNVTC